VCCLAISLSAACAFDRPSPGTDLPRVTGTPVTNLTAAAVADYQPGVDYFPQKASFRHAEQIAVSYHGHYKVARVTTRGVGERFEYVFVQRGTPVPSVSPDAIIVAVPVERFSLGTFRYGGAADRLGVVPRLVGYGNHAGATVPAILELFERGVLSRNFSVEAMARRGTEAHFNWHFHGSLSRGNETFARVGVPLVEMAEHLEPTPLARTEWVKFFALFFNKEADADALFDAAEQRYLSLRSVVAEVAVRPLVLVGAPQADGWQVYGGRNVHARMIAEAGGRYLWDDNASQESLRTVAFEDALVRARPADVWILGPDTSSGPHVRENTVDDPRYGYIPAVRDGRVFVANRNYPTGPNPWWDQALIHPDRELADYIRMIHPARLPDHELTLHLPLHPAARSESNVLPH
jgi:iron complex transport system substrate-binding protein